MTFRQNGISWIDVLVFLFCVLFIGMLLLPLLEPKRNMGNRVACRANMRQIVISMQIYAGENRDHFPRHYFAANNSQDRPNNPAGRVDTGINWVGTMGSSTDLRISQETSPKTSPTASHPSRSLYLLVINAMLVTKPFVCPNSKDIVDDWRNYGADMRGTDSVEAAQPGATRFDFRGYNNLSYGMRFPYSGATFTTEMDPNIPMAADKGPYYEKGEPGLPGTRTVRDKRSRLSPPEEWRSLTAEQVLDLPKVKLKKFNSRHHEGEGQNIGYVDGHAEFRETPFASTTIDNLYTLRGDKNSLDSLIGVVADIGDTHGPADVSDTFIVP